jgi:Saxitoxin biosynthesis operon protein SxtJ
MIWTMRTLFHALKRGWMAFAHALGKVNTVIILTLFYFVLLAPIGLIVRLSSFLKGHSKPQWIMKKSSPVTIQTLHRPF